MKKNLFFAALAVVALTFPTSCGSDDDDISGVPGVNPTDVPTSAGDVSSGTDADKNLPDGYKIASVGGLEYEYDENGKLIMVDGFTINNGVMSGDGWMTKISVNNKGLITTTYDKEVFNEYGENGLYECTMTCTYNSNDQLSSTRCVFKYEETYDGVKCTESGSANCTFTYEGKKLVKVTSDGNGQETEGKYTEKYSEKQDFTFIYENSPVNTFYQYTPYMEEVIDDISWECSYLSAFCYLGLVGKASSMLPAKIIEDEEHIEDGEKETHSHTTNCGPYSFNSYGALSSADGEKYTYTTVGGTRAATPVWQASTKRLTAKERIAKLHERMRRNK